MKSTIFKSRVAILVLFLAVQGTAYSAPSTGAPNTGELSSPNSTHRGTPTQPHNVRSCATEDTPEDEQELKENIAEAVTNVFREFTEHVNEFKSKLNGLIDPNSDEKLKVTCENLNIAIEEADNIFISKFRTKYERLISEHASKGEEPSAYCELLGIFLKITGELKDHFNILYKTLHRSLQGRPTAIKVAKTLKPVIDEVTKDDNFVSIDTHLADAAEITREYDLPIEISPELIKQITEEDILEDTYCTQVSDAIESIREALEELRQECRKPSTLSAGELLRMIRKRL